MNSEIADETFFEICTDRFPEHERVAMWRDIVASRAIRIESEPLPGSDFRVEVRGRSLPGLMVARANLSGMRDSRAPGPIADGDDDINLIINLRGPVCVSMRGRDTRLGDGDGFMMTSAEPCVVTRPAPGMTLGVSLPREALKPLVPDLDDVVGRLIPAGSSALRLLRGYLEVLVDETMPTAPELRQSVRSHVAELLAFALGSARHSERGGAIARLRAIKSDIFQNLGRRDLTIAALAQRHDLSERYVQMLFESERTTFSGFLLERRLERVHRALTDPRFDHHSISALAYESGFGDLSYFNRTFRRRYGMTPSERRMRGRGERD